MIITAGRFKARCLKIMDDVQQNAYEVIITKYGRPVAKLTRATGLSTIPLFGALKNTVLVEKDITSPTGEVWDAQ